MTDGEVAADGNSASRHIIGVGQRDGVNVREVGGVEDDEFVGRAKHRSAAGDHDAVRLLANRHAERLHVQLSLLKLTPDKK